MLDINDGISQRKPDGTVRLIDGKPVSARVTMVPWPDKDLQVLRAATTVYLASVAGPSDASARTDAQREAATVLDAMTRFAAGAAAAKPVGFPATAGLRLPPRPMMGSGLLPAKGVKQGRSSLSIRSRQRRPRPSRARRSGDCRDPDRCSAWKRTCCPFSVICTWPDNPASLRRSV
jgi:hypothetical protein